ncbi:NAD(P)H-dependent oxidoreductase [Pseudovibrio sp. Ad26]|uniref:NAD(P)H-dependent oxidoreductase n=1 Tax=Pseudovibrio sp. Ad26 TaxID=989410 RepID=UPI0007AEBB5B|nr:NAD(P)H-dependent oxidoreductase [Pseudovibrio sp. Ad26]KZK99123.1 NADPH azoreductase [Pseudovibrio sp. Ad26]
MSETSFDLTDLPKVEADSFHPIKTDALRKDDAPDHAPRILLLYGSLRKRSFSRLAVLEVQRILEQLGAETRIFNPSGLPLADDAEPDHPKVQELRELMMWSEGQVWCSPERHGSMTVIMKTMIDWVPLSAGAVRPTQGKTLALMQVSGGSQSFNALNQMRVLGRWMRMKPSPLYDRVVDVMEELMKFTHLTHGHSDYLTDRYSERKETAAELSARVNTK